jgi:transcriptional regulator with GAF, ATPase, and Fis domain
MHVSTLIYQPPGCNLRQLATDFAAEAGPNWEVTVVASADDLRVRLADRSRQHLVILPDAIGRNPAAGLALVARLLRIDPHLPIVVTAEKGDVDAAARAIDAGAADFLVRGENLRQRIATLLGKLRVLFGVIDRNRALDEDNTELRRTLHAGLEIVGNSPPMKRLLAQVRRVAAVPRPVLIVGERGTGKELVARAIHLAAGAASRTLVTVNCAAFGDALLESELFGHEKGAFTGAIAQKAGRFEFAHQGTLFLDEVGDIPLELQPKLLRVLQEKEFERLGGNRTIRIDIRLVAATNQDLAKMVADGEFRSDLYYRLNVFPIRVPALRERAEDIPLLVRYFVQNYARRMNKLIDSISAEDMETLTRYAWPGNVRELENLIERAVILSPGSVLRIPTGQLATQPGAASAPTTLEAAEREHILRILDQTKWVIAGPNGAASRLGMKRTTLQSKLKKLGISRHIQ